MKQYLNLMQDILDNGTWQNNRTGIRTKMFPGAMLKFDLRDGFPTVTTKKLAFNAVKGELLGFLRGVDTAKGFNDLGCKVWNANASAQTWVNNKSNVMPDGDWLGRIYGKQWTDWAAYDGTRFNQISWLLDQIKTNPTSRRLVVSAWRPDEINQMALPPCHYAFQVIIEQDINTMHLLWNQRSCDMFLGVPFNIASYALLLEILAKLTGYTAGTLTGFLADAHIYENHLTQVVEQISRKPLILPKLVLNFEADCEITEIEPNMISLNGYESHASIKAEMAV